MRFDLADVQLQTFILRVIHAFLILSFSIYLYRTAHVVNNQTLTTAFWKASLFIGAYFVMRIIAGMLDSLLAFNVGWFSNLIDIFFLSYIVWRARKIFVILASPRNDETRISLRSDLDVLITRVKSAKAISRKLLPLNSLDD